MGCDLQINSLLGWGSWQIITNTLTLEIRKIWRMQPSLAGRCDLYCSSLLGMATRTLCNGVCVCVDGCIGACVGENGIISIIFRYKEKNTPKTCLVIQISIFTFYKFSCLNGWMSTTDGILHVLMSQPTIFSMYMCTIINFKALLSTANENKLIIEKLMSMNESDWVTEDIPPNVLLSNKRFFLLPSLAL